ncbi:MAG: hypothetical protein IK058_01015 [Bacteroidales bacterium]|nr:hypothetical protein [Bacteroidales bacterium]
MKRLLTMSVAFAILLSSCSEKDNVEGSANNTNNRKLEKTLVLSYNDYGDFTSGGINSDRTYGWNNDKLMKVLGANGTWSYDFSYDGDNVSEVFWYSIYQDNIRPYRRFSYSYTNNRVSDYTITYLGSQDEIISCHVDYNDKGEVSTITENHDNYNRTVHYTWSNGNLVQKVTRQEGLSSGVRSSTNTTTYTYGNNKPLGKLIKGYDATRYASGYSPSSINNVLATVSHTIYDDGTESSETTDYTYIYDGEYISSSVHSYSPSGTIYTSYYKYTNTSDPTPTTYNIIAPREYGNGNIVKGNGVYASGKTVKLLAVPGEGYHFVRWSDGSTSNPMVFTATSDVRYEATFEAD